MICLCSSRKKGFICILIVFILLFSNGRYFFSKATGNKLSERFPSYHSSDGSDAKDYYLNYLSQIADHEIYPDKQINISVLDALTSQGKVPVLHRNGEPVLDWSKDTLEWVQWSFNIPKAGLYNIEIDYRALKGTVESPRRSLEIDGGKIDFHELSNIVFPRCWYDDGKPWINVLGDQVRPKQSEKFIRQAMKIEDSLGKYDEPLKFYFESGNHTIKLSYIQEPIELYGVKILPAVQIKSYDEVLVGWKKLGYKEAFRQIKIDAESPIKKTESSLRLEFSADPLADPVSSGNTVFNAIGGSGWNKGNQGIMWEFDVAESGLYCIDFRMFQKYNDGLSSFRQILFDGKVPYREFLCYEFKYGGWQDVRAKSDSGEPLLIYLEEGKHTLEMKVKISEYTEILYEMEQTLSLFSKVIQNIIMITGITPDTNFDYKFFEKLPWLEETLSEISLSLQRQIEGLTKSLNKIPGPVNSLSTIKYRVDKMRNNPFLIAANLDYLIDEQTTLSSWIRGFNNLPLTLDYILLNNPKSKAESKKAHAFQVIWFAVRNFYQSFFRDYDFVAGENANGEEIKTINAWISRGKDWGEIIKQIADEDFTKRTGINIKMNILPAGQLGTSGVMLLAVASGTAPDLVLGSQGTVPAEYGMRGVLVDLRTMHNYDEIAGRFAEGVMMPYRFKDSIYALPETMDFSVMFYRKDILSSFNLKPPDTWDELYRDVLPVLKRNGMDFWYEGGIITFLFQHGGSMYSKDGLKSALDTQEAFEAFGKYANLYRIYDVPVSANFYTRFRAGQMPIGISSFNTYLLLTSAAPELNGKWDVTLIPGTVREDGTIDRSDSASSSATMIFNSSQLINESWKFLEWYTSAEIQTRYAGDLVAYIGPEAKWFSANIESFDALSWDNNLKRVVKEQRKWCKGVPSVVGGYITSRHIENARVRAVVQGKNYRESLERAAKDINRELGLKNKEFQRRIQQSISG